MHGCMHRFSCILACVMRVCGFRGCMQTGIGYMRGHAGGHRAKDCMRAEDGVGARLWSTLDT
jgi:hypothetical protein